MQPNKLVNTVHQISTLWQPLTVKCFWSLYWIILSQFSISEETWWSFIRNLYLPLLNVSTCKLQHFITFVIRKENFMSLWYIAQDCMSLYFLLLGIWKAHHSHIVHYNNIKFSFLFTKVTKCWNLHVDAFRNTKYKFFIKLHHVSSLIEKVIQR